jgi:hypothetical protein
MMETLSERPSDPSLLSQLYAFTELLRSLPIDAIFWQIQNTYYKLAKTTYREFLLRAKTGNEDAAKWVDMYRSIGEKLFFNTSAVLPAD